MVIMWRLGHILEARPRPEGDADLRHVPPAGRGRGYTPGQAAPGTPGKGMCILNSCLTMDRKYFVLVDIDIIPAAMMLAV